MATHKEQILACIAANPAIGGGEVGKLLPHIRQSSIHARISELVHDDKLVVTADPEDINKRVYSVVVRRTRKTAPAMKPVRFTRASTVVASAPAPVAPTPAPAPADATTEGQQLLKGMLAACENLLNAVKQALKQ